MYVYMMSYIYICTNIYMSLCIYIHIYVYSFIYVIYMCNIYVCICIYIYIYIYVYIYVCIEIERVCISVYKYTYLVHLAVLCPVYSNSFLFFWFCWQMQLTNFGPIFPYCLPGILHLLNLFQQILKFQFEGVERPRNSSYSVFWKS